MCLWARRGLMIMMPRVWSILICVFVTPLVICELAEDALGHPEQTLRVAPAPKPKSGGSTPEGTAQRLVTADTLLAAPTSPVGKTYGGSNSGPNEGDTGPTDKWISGAKSDASDGLTGSGRPGNVNKVSGSLLVADVEDKQGAKLLTTFASFNTTVVSEGFVLAGPLFGDGVGKVVDNDKSKVFQEKLVDGGDTGNGNSEIFRGIRANIGDTGNGNSVIFRGIRANIGDTGIDNNEKFPKVLSSGIDTRSGNSEIFPEVLSNEGDKGNDIGELFREVLSNRGNKGNGIGELFQNVLSKAEGTGNDNGELFGKMFTSKGNMSGGPIGDLSSIPVNHEFDHANKSSKCVPDYCEILSPCHLNEVCVMTPLCMTRCLNNQLTESTTESAAPVLQPGNTTTLRPVIARSCDKGFLGNCMHGVIENCSSEPISCICDVGWTGELCNLQCDLPCVHGECQVTNNRMRCVCKNQFVGKLCQEVIQDPEERPRIIAVVLLSALAVVVTLAVVVPVAMWKLRVTFVLRLVYYFKEYEDEDGKTYDAYVSMTPTLNAENFVYSSLRPILEELNFTLYLQARDALAGEVLSETILSALEKSRRTIMIVTRDYITNEWNRFEYLIAQHETLKLKQRIIPIILEDVDKDRTKMDKSLKHILDSVKCLKYPQAKPESLNSVESPDIQSPDSNRSIDGTTFFFRIQGQNSNTASTSKEDQKLEKKVAKFWKHLTLTMPKKKSKEKKPSNILAKLHNRSSYDLTKHSLQHDGAVKPGIIEYNMQSIKIG